MEVTFLFWFLRYYRQAFNIIRTLAGNNIVDHSDVVAPTTTQFLT